MRIKLRASVIIALILSLLMSVATAIVLLITNGDKHDEDKDLAISELTLQTYTATQVPLDDAINNTMGMYNYGDNIYILGYLYKGADASQRRIMSVDADDKDISEVVLPLQDEEYLVCTFMDLNGNTLAVTCLEKSDGLMFYLNKFDENNALMFRFEITEYSLGNDWFYVNGIAADAESNIYLACNTGLAVLDCDGNKVYFYEADKGISSVIVTRDSNIIAKYFDDELGITFAMADLEEKVLKPLSGADFSSWSTDLFADGVPNGDYDFYVTDMKKLYGYSLENHQQTEILDWTKSGINASQINRILALADGGFAVSCYDNNTNAVSLFILDEDSHFQDVQYDTITLGLLYDDPEIQKYAAEFNRNNDDVNVNIRCYSDEYQDASFDEIAELFNQDLLAGQMPDVLFLGNADYEKLAENNLLADISLLMQEDDQFNPNDYNQHIFELYQDESEKLLRMPISYGISTIIGNVDDLEGKTGWTMAELDEYTKGLPSGTAAFDGITASGMLLYLMTDMTEYGENFENEEFKSALEYAKRIGDAQAQEQDSMLEFVTIYDLVEYNRTIKERFEGNAVLIGYPARDRMGNYVLSQEMYAISEGSQNKEAAWDFLKGLIDSEYQNSAKLKGLPVNLEAYQDKLSIAMDTASYDGTSINALTSEEAQQLFEIVDEITKVACFDAEKYQIISEEASGYFAGTVTIEETLMSIRSRI